MTVLLPGMTPIATVPLRSSSSKKKLTGSMLSRTCRNGATGTFSFARSRPPEVEHLEEAREQHRVGRLGEHHVEGDLQIGSADGGDAAVLDDHGAVLDHAAVRHHHLAGAHGEGASLRGQGRGEEEGGEKRKEVVASVRCGSGAGAVVEDHLAVDDDEERDGKWTRAAARTRGRDRRRSRRRPLPDGFAHAADLSGTGSDQRQR